MSVVLTILIGLLIVGGMLLSRIMAIFSIFDIFQSFRMEQKVWDMYDDAVEKQRNDQSRW